MDNAVLMNITNFILIFYAIVATAFIAAASLALIRLCHSNTDEDKSNKTPSSLDRLITHKCAENSEPIIETINGTINNSKNLLILVDVQKDFITEASSWLPSKLARYIEKSNYKDIIATKYLNHKNSACYQYLNWQGCMTKEQQDICPELDGLYSKVFMKDTYSSATPDLIKYLKVNNFEEIHICGISSSCCVLATAYSLFDHGFNIKVIPELSAVTAAQDGYQEAVNFLLKENLPCLEIE